MITLGELKTNIMKILCEYSKNGRILTEDIPSVKDRMLSIDFAIDVALRKVMTVCGLESGRETITASQNEDVCFPLPQDFAALELLLDPNGNICESPAYIANSLLCFKAKKDGTYVLIYKHYPHSVAGESDDYNLSLDAYITDAVAYGAAAELCNSSEGELFGRIKYRFDELMANRYNVDKLHTPPFNRVYTEGKRKRNVI